MSRHLSLALAVASLLAACTTAPPATPKREPIRYSAGPSDDPEARAKWFWNQRVYPTGSVPVEVHRAAVKRELEQTRILAEDDAAWTNLGPAPLRDITYGRTSQHASGRALTIAMHPLDTNVLFLGTAQGGIWKSTDGGANWHSVAERTLPSLAINIIRFSPADPNVLFAGTGEPNGSTSVHGSGLLRSTDGGASWELLPGRGNGWNFEYAAITGLEFDVRDPNTLYLSTATIQTANPFFRTPPNPPTTGIFKSTDGGSSWRLLKAATKHPGPTSSAGIMDLEYGGTHAPDLLYASEYLGGILKSENRGETWSYITPRKANGTGAFPADVPALSYFDTKTRGYLLLTRFPNAEGVSDFRRVEIGLAKSNPRVLYLGYESTTNRLDYDRNGAFDAARDRTIPSSLMFKSEDGGGTWRWLGTIKDGIPDYCASQCTYDNVITVNPADENDVLIGGSANYNSVLPYPLDVPKSLTELPWRGMVYRSLDGGKSWVDTTPHCTKIAKNPVTKFGSAMPIYECQEFDTTKVIHPDTHNIAYGRDGKIYVMNDGGVYRASVTLPTPRGRRRAVSAGPDAAPGTYLDYTWENLNNGLSTLQFYRVGSHPTDPNIILGGMQDNSCGYWNGETWEGWGGGDGTIAVFNPHDPNYVYLGSQFAVHRHDHGGTKEFTDLAGWKWNIFGPSMVKSGETTSFVPVFALDPVEPTIAYATSNAALYRSTNRGNAFKRVTEDQVTDGVPTWVSVSPVNHNLVWMGTSTGKIYRYDFADDGTPTITNLTGANMPGRSVSRVMAGFDSADTVYAVFHGYDANTPTKTGKVFLSTDGGQTWTNISGDLPDVPATAIAIDKFDVNRLFVSTDTAVFSTSNRGTNWISERRNMPIVAVQDLELNQNTGYLIAATHGRGVWRMRVRSAASGE
jgi:photosystem II stability/assembly factor-like uncharacterized protein